MAGQGASLAHVGLIGEGIEPTRQIGFDPEADAFFADLQVLSDLGDAPAHIREAHHLQSVARAGHHPGFMCSSVQLLTGGFI